MSGGQGCGIPESALRGQACGTVPGGDLIPVRPRLREPVPAISQKSYRTENRVDGYHHRIPTTGELSPLHLKPLLPRTDHNP